MEVTSVVNTKGGVGKSTTTHNLAGALAPAGRRVLLIDNDPQSSLSQGLLGPSEAEALDPRSTIAAVYSGAASPAAVIRTAVVQEIDLVPSSIHTDRHNNSSPEEAPWPDQVVLRDFRVEGEHLLYDVALIDNPPNLHLCRWAALAALAWVPIPVMPEDYGSQGLAAVRRSIARVQFSVNPGRRRSAGQDLRDSAGANRGGSAAPAPPSGGAPARSLGVERGRDMAMIPVEKIDRDPDQPRTEFDEDELSRLAESLRIRGQLQPIRVRWDEGRGPTSSWRASVAGGWRGWPAPRSSPASPTRAT